MRYFLRFVSRVTIEIETERYSSWGKSSFRGRCQWVLDTTCQVGEWPSHCGSTPPPSVAYSPK